jgi:two-component system cell cycle response regulator
MSPSAYNASGPGRLRVLVVDDEDDLRLHLKGLIEELGCSCTTAKDGVEAWQLHRAKPFDVVLCDWIMPRMDGPRLCRKMRAEGGHPYTYFVFMTSLADKAHLAEGLRAGADEYMTKPFDVDELGARLSSAARVTAMHRALLDNNAVLRRESQRSLQIARIDSLTGIGNRLRLSEDLAAARARGLRYGRPNCIALCDIDFFKQYNDRCGHVAGDDVLRRIADALRRNLRDADTIYRYGGDEFLALLPEQLLASAAIAMDRMRQAVEALAIVASADAPGAALTISVGIAQLAANDDTDEDWIRRADVALYEAKSSGRNRIGGVEAHSQGTAFDRIARRAPARTVQRCDS